MRSVHNLISNRPDEISATEISLGSTGTFFHCCRFGFVGLLGFVEFVEFVGLLGFVGFVGFIAPVERCEAASAAQISTG